MVIIFYLNHSNEANADLSKNWPWYLGLTSKGNSAK